jgi:hypothetical protein
MRYLKELFYHTRFNFIQTLWKPADHRAKPLFLQNFIKKYWAPSAAINQSGQNSARNLTDEILAYDLPFLLAENSGIRDLDLSHNHLGSRTVAVLDKKLFRSKIKSLNLSHNPLDEAARNRLPHLIRDLTRVNLSNCNLSEQNIKDLLYALTKNPNLIELDVSKNQATQLQLTELNKCITRNVAYNKFKNEFQKKDVLDLERYPLNAEVIKDLAYYISMNAPLFFFSSSFIKEIKAPIVAQGLKDADFEPLIEALKKNNRVTTLTMDFRQLTPETEQKIRTQLMFNKARQKMRSNSGILKYLITGFMAASIITAIMPALSFALVFLGAIVSQVIYNIQFFHHLQQAKYSDFSQRENTQVIERGKNSTDTWLSYLNPRTYTPMAYLGYMIEKENLSIKYEVKTECFKPKSQRTLV